MDNESPISLHAQKHLADNVCKSVNLLVDCQFDLHPDVLQAAVNMQVEANRLRFMVQQLIDGTYEPKQPKLRKPRKVAKVSP